MNESKLYEALGRKQAQLEAQDAAYTDLITILANVVNGSIHPDRVAVNLNDRTWFVTPTNPTATE